jgi:hypothetical protein
VLHQAVDQHICGGALTGVKANKNRDRRSHGDYQAIEKLVALLNSTGLKKSLPAKLALPM